MRITRYAVLMGALWVSAGCQKAREPAPPADGAGGAPMEAPNDAPTIAPPPTPPPAAVAEAAATPSKAPPPSASVIPPPPALSPSAAAALSAAARCGRLPHEPIVRAQWGFSKELAGGNDCDAIATVWANVAHADRTCSTDADCVAVSGDGHCFQATLNRGAAKQARYAKTPCGNPASGACINRNLTPRCASGCCELPP